MFIEIRKKGKKRKFYAAHSFREGKQVIKIRSYLGQDLTAQELERRKRQAEQRINEQLKGYREIRDPLKTALSDSELNQLKHLQAGFRIFHLSEEQWERFSEVFSYNTNAIEGSTLTLKEVRELIEKKKLPDKSEGDIEEAKGVVEAIRYLRRPEIKVSLDLIKTIHRIIFRNTKPFAGQFRDKGVEVVIRDKMGRIVHVGAPSNKIEYLLMELIQWYDHNKKKYPPILLAAVMHNQLENIHPFQDGNGRVGRLLMNTILMKHRLPPVNIELKRRQEYYEALISYQKKGDIRPMVELMLKEYRAYLKQR